MANEVVNNGVNYGDDNIRTLEGVEHIRLRPGMYIGRLGNGEDLGDGIYGFTPPLPHSQRVSSCSGDPREHNCYRPPPPPDQNPDPRRPGSPRPWRAPGALPTSTRGSR